MKKKTYKHFGFGILGLFLVILSSCMNTKTVSRNYEFATDDICDCYTKHPLILVGAKSHYYSKEKAFCTRWSFDARNDSIVKLKSLINELEYGSAYSEMPEDSIEIRIDSVKSIIGKLEVGWTHSRIKTKWKNSSEGTRILKQKVKFYNKFKSGRKFVGMKKYKNGSLVKVKFEEQIQH